MSSLTRSMPARATATMLALPLATGATARRFATVTFGLASERCGGRTPCYTNAGRPAGRSPANAPPRPTATLGPGGAPPLPPEGERLRGLAVGRNLPAPEDLSRENFDTRPCAAWLRGALHLSSAGPCALGEAARNPAQNIDRGQAAGTIVQRSPSVHEKPLVGEAKVGAVLLVPGGPLSSTDAARSEECETRDLERVRLARPVASFLSRRRESPI